MQDVVRHGTATRANAVGRSDIAGKTGTTNDNKDAWFVGFNPELVAAVYIGYDKPRSMGRAGYGGTIAVPVWVDYMRFALNGVAVKGMASPDGVVSRGGEYYLREQQTTNPELPLDNRSSRPVRSEEVDSSTRGGAEAGPAEQGGGDAAPAAPATPAAPANSGGGGSLDSLF